MSILNPVCKGRSSYNNYNLTFVEKNYFAFQCISLMIKSLHINDDGAKAET